MSKKTHYSHSKVARRMAANDWGREHESIDKAMKAMSADEIANGALLELVRRMNQAIVAWSLDEDCSGRDAASGDVPGEGAIPFPDLQVGDFLFRCNDDLTEGINEYVVMFKDDGGFVRVVEVGRNCRDRMIYTDWADDEFFRTREEAALSSAAIDYKWHAPRVRQIEAIREAISKGQDFDHLLGDPDELFGVDESAPAPIEPPG